MNSRCTHWTRKNEHRGDSGQLVSRTMATLQATSDPATAVPLRHWPSPCIVSLVLPATGSQRPVTMVFVSQPSSAASQTRAVHV